MKSNRPIAHIICGFIGAGKTTFARKLETDTGAIRITKDEWAVKIFGNNITSDAKFEKYDGNITTLATEIAFKIIQAGCDVIIDEGFWVKSQRDDIKTKVLKLGAQPILYYVECPVELMRERVVARSAHPPEDSFEITGEMFNGYLQYWDPPTEAENPILVK